MPSRKPSKPHVHIIYTGGTFGMELDEKKRFRVPKLSASDLRKRFLNYVPELNRVASSRVSVLMNTDSSQLGFDDWKRMAQAIWRLKRSSKEVSGFVLLHGTDTLAYGASALTYLLAGLGRPVVLTGAQRPLAAIRTDARRNLISSVEIAANAPRPQANRVMVFFNDRLFLGSKVRKRSPTEFNAFESPRFPSLAQVGSTIHYSETFRNFKKPKAFKPIPLFSERVGFLQLTPGFDFSLWSRWIGALEGLVLSVFPSGTAPTKDPRFVSVIRACRARKIPVVVVTERSGWASSPRTYEAGAELMKWGCLSGGDLTPENAYVSLSLALKQKGSVKASFRRLQLF